MALQFEIVTVTAFAQNCSVLWCDESKQAAVVDPGGDLPRIEAVLRRNSLAISKILLTHGHIDHAGAAADLADKSGVAIEGPHVDEQFWIDALADQSRMFGFPPARTFAPSRWLQDGDEVLIGNERLQVFHCPGHTPGHVVFFHAASELAVVGDVLFAGSIGRTDFPRGNHGDLINAIRTKLWPLGNAVRFIPGHGPMSTFGAERANNPFVADSVR